MGCGEVSLRQLEHKDAVRMLEWMHNEDVTQYLQLNGKEKTIDDAISFIQNAADEIANLHRAIVDSADTYLGTISLKNIDREMGSAEYAVALHQDAIGTGVAAAASEQILTIAFEQLMLKQVYLNVLEENSRAIRFYEKFGFVYEKTTVETINHQKKNLRWYTISIR